MFSFVIQTISYFTSKSATNESFFVGERKSPWYVVAFGMIGASLSGITFISVPGWVASSQFSYMQMVFGFFCGYFIIARILLPLYYRLELTSIYTYLRDRFGNSSYKTGSSFFLLSRTIGASFRLFLIATVLQFAVFESWNIPFYVTVIITISLIWLYTYRSGMKTIIWTDTLQTTFMLSTVVLIAYTLMQKMDVNVSSVVSLISDSDYSRMFFFDDWTDKKYFFKQFFSGMFMAIVMTGLDQDQMQKNLSCKNLKSAQLNMVSFAGVLIIVNFIFLVLGALLFMYFEQTGVGSNVLKVSNPRTDLLFAEIAKNG